MISFLYHFFPREGAAREHLLEAERLDGNTAGAQLFEGGFFAQQRGAVVGVVAEIDLSVIHKYLLHYTWLAQILIIAGDHHYAVAFLDIVLRFKSRFHYLLLYTPIFSGVV